jgi:hypothetical protein
MRHQPRLIAVGPFRIVTLKMHAVLGPLGAGDIKLDEQAETCSN